MPTTVIRATSTTEAALPVGAGVERAVSQLKRLRKALIVALGALAKQLSGHAHSRYG